MRGRGTPCIWGSIPTPARGRCSNLACVTVRAPPPTGRPTFSRSRSRPAAQSDDRPLLRKGDFDAVFVLADGLSARAVHEHAASLLTATLDLLPGWRMAPVVLAHQARVALGDEIAGAGARMVVMLIGERPGLSAADSLGAYLTFGPGRGFRTPTATAFQHPAERAGNPSGAAQTGVPDDEAVRLKLSGVGLKNDVPAELLEPRPDRTNPFERIMINSGKVY